jgi:hypothetical protein
MPLRARDIADICDELAIERASVTVMGGWDPDCTQLVLTFGPFSANRQTMVIDPKWEISDVRVRLEAASMPPDASYAVAQAIKPQPGDDAQPAKPAQKRKKANASSRKA